MKPKNYPEALTELEAGYLKVLTENKALLEKIYLNGKASGLFLPKPTEAYFDSPVRVAVIGQETRGWHNGECEFKNGLNISPESISNAMMRVESFISKRPGKYKFLQYYKKVSRTLCNGSSDTGNSAVWLNQFCVSVKGRSPVKSSQFKEIRDLSEKLLQLQFEVLKPDIAIFTTGSARDKFLKNCFPELAEKNSHSKVIVPRRLWQFKIGETNCFRINHPRWYGSYKYREEALKRAKEIANRQIPENQ